MIRTGRSKCKQPLQHVLSDEHADRYLALRRDASSWRV